MPYKLQFITYHSSLLLRITFNRDAVRFRQIPADHNEDHAAEIIEAKQCCLKHITNQEQEAANGSHRVSHQSVPACEADLHTVQEHTDTENNEGDHGWHTAAHCEFKDLVMCIYICLSREFLHPGIDADWRNTKEEASGINKHGFERRNP